MKLIERIKLAFRILTDSKLERTYDINENTNAVISNSDCHHYSMGINENEEPYVEVDGVKYMSADQWSVEIVKNIRKKQDEKNIID